MATEQKLCTDSINREANVQLPYIYHPNAQLSGTPQVQSPPVSLQNSRGSEPGCGPPGASEALRHFEQPEKVWNLQLICNSCRRAGERPRVAAACKDERDSVLFRLDCDTKHKRSRLFSGEQRERRRVRSRRRRGRSLYRNETFLGEGNSCILTGGGWMHLDHLSLGRLYVKHTS